MLLPEGWSHATLNTADCSAIGRQRQRRADRRTRLAKAAFVAAGQSAGPGVLLEAGLALRVSAVQMRNPGMTKKALGMLHLAAGLQDNDGQGDLWVEAPVRLRALLALLYNTQNGGPSACRSSPRACSVFHCACKGVPDPLLAHTDGA